MTVGYLSMRRQVDALKALYPAGLPDGVSLEERDVAILTNGTTQVVHALGQYDVWEPGDDLFGQPAPTRFDVKPDEARAMLEGIA